MNSVNCKKRTADRSEPPNLTLEESDTQPRFRGVRKHKTSHRYEAHLWDGTWKVQVQGVTGNGKQVYLGSYDSAEKASRAYDIAALKLLGSSAKTNFHPSDYEKEMKEMEGITKEEVVGQIRRTSTAFSRGASKYRGVTRCKRKWQARIKGVANIIFLGSFDTEEEAAAAYDTAIIKYRGRNAMTNFDINNYDVDKIVCAESCRPTRAHSKCLKQTETSATTYLPTSCLNKTNSVDPQMDATSSNRTVSAVLDQHLPESQGQQRSQPLVERPVNQSDISLLSNQTMGSSLVGGIGGNGVHDGFLVYVVDPSTGVPYYVPRTAVIPVFDYQSVNAPRFINMTIPNPFLQNLQIPTSQVHIAPTAQFQNSFRM